MEINELIQWRRGASGNGALKHMIDREKPSTSVYNRLIYFHCNNMQLTEMDRLGSCFIFAFDFLLYAK